MKLFFLTLFLLLRLTVWGQDYEYARQQAREIGYEIVDSGYKGYVVRKDGRFGVIDLNFNLLIPMKYDKIYWDNDLGYRLELNKKIGKATFSGHIICEPLYQDVRLTTDLYYLAPMEYQYFYVLDSSNKIGLIDYHGNLVIPLNNQMIEVYYDRMDSLHPPKQVLAVARPYFKVGKGKNTKYSSRARVYNLVKKTQSDEYETAEPFRDKVIVSTDGRWAILDSSYREIYSGIGDPPGSTLIPWSKNDPPISVVDGGDEPYLFRFVDDSVVQFNQYQNGFSLLNFYSGNQTSHYDQVWKNNAYYFMAVCYDAEPLRGLLPFSFRSQPNGRITFFDQKLNFVSSFEFRDSYFSQAFGEASAGNTGQLCLFKNENGLWGAVNARGEVVIPFEYEWGENLEWLVNGYSRSGITDQSRYFKMTKDRKDRVFDKNGVQIVPPNYDDIELLDDRFFLVKTDSLYGLLNIDGKTILPAEYWQIQFQNGFFTVRGPQGWALLDSNFKAFITNYTNLVGLYCDNGIYCRPENRKSLGTWRLCAIRGKEVFLLDHGNLVKIDPAKLEDGFFDRK